VSLRRALSRGQRVAVATSSSSLPCSFFDNFRYALAYFAVISTRAAIGN
jgi:hypothetical protein